MARRRDILRVAALLAAGAYLVHVLRYALVFGADASRELSVTGHGYLDVVCVLLVGLLALAGGQFVVQYAGPREAAPPSPGVLGCNVPVARAWFAATATLLVIFVAQESIEGALAAGHTGGLGGVLGGGGWLAVPLCAAVAAFVVAVQCGARAALDAPAARIELLWMSRGTPRLVAWSDSWWVGMPGRRRPLGRAPPLSVA